jgi:hypothetical protein
MGAGRAHPRLQQRVAGGLAILVVLDLQADDVDVRDREQDDLTALCPHRLMIGRPPAKRRTLNAQGGPSSAIALVQPVNARKMASR